MSSTHTLAGGDGENANIDEQGHLREGGGGADTRVVTGIIVFTVLY
jgi:hypothetical protein